VGLSACREIVEAHQGRLRVESSVGKGTAFTVRLPMWQEKSESAAAAPIAPLGVPNSLASSASPNSLGI
jgi:hypothetical protein